MACEHFSPQRLSENVREHILGRTPLQCDYSTTNELPNEVMAQIDVFGTCMKNGILSYGLGALVIYIDEYWVLREP
jgi:hypothetical protein